MKTLCSPSVALQGTPLDVKPSKIQAEDPDEEIRAPIKYSFNSGRFPILALEWCHLPAML